MNQIYAYLARKDKKGIKTIASFSSNTKCYPTKIEPENLNKIQLADSIKISIEKELAKDRLMYDIYLESSDSYDSLRKALLKRGYKNIPPQQVNLILNKNTQINSKSLITQESTMIRRNSDQARRT